MGGSGERPWRLGVGVMLLNAAGLVFVAQRLDSRAEAWQMPQGGIDPGEEPLAAARRELREETSIDRVALLAESTAWYDYELPAEIAARVWGGRYRGQRQKWFCFRFLGQDDDIDVATEDPEFGAWRWVALDELPSLIVAFKRPLYERLVRDFAHLAKP